MSNNSLIPYSFTPGTKAKAQEVNANFIALAEKIGENREYTTSKITETVEQIEENASELENKKADKDLSNTNLLTNCILECPNGVVTVSENIITVKSGLKVMLPDGFNSDGTVKNIIYEVEEDTPVTTVSNSEINCIYVTSGGCFYATAYNTCETEPKTKQGVWYKMSENKAYLYKSDTKTWDVIQAIVVATYKNTSDTVTLVEVAKPVRLLTYHDKRSIVNWGMPAYSTPVTQSPTGTYTAKQYGYLLVFGRSNGDYECIILNNYWYFLNWGRSGNGTMLPLKPGDTYYFYGSFEEHHIEFIPMEGVV